MFLIHKAGWYLNEKGEDGRIHSGDAWSNIVFPFLYPMVFNSYDNVKHFSYPQGPQGDWVGVTDGNAHPAKARKSEAGRTLQT